MSRRALTDEAFAALLRRPEIDSATQSLVHEAQSDLAQARQQVTEVERQIDQLTGAAEVLEALTAGKELTIDSVQQALDVGARYAAFKLATHYWEARYLLQLQEHFQSKDRMEDSKSPARLQAQYRRLAKLHPCFVATLFTLPDKFIAYPSPSESVALCNAIDLLIVDEAAQVAPEIGAPSFALAKRALVVGDVDQIEPIWSIPGHIDGANAVGSGVVAGEAGLPDFRASGMAASNGSLMRMAQRATPYAKYPERGRGMFLSEHRRCWPEIIRMCNVLVYGGRLQPCREDKGERKIVPSVGYVHIPGTARSRGGSRDNPVEAAAIAQWLALRRPEIEAAYANEPIGRLVAVITPFSAQSRRVGSALDDALGKAHGITVGTVHSLQGAERRIVIFSPAYGLGTEPGDTFIDRNRSILNVAISRAQDAFLVFGNMHLFQPVGQHPCAVIGRMLFGDGSNEISGVPPALLVPEQQHMGAGRLIADLEGHRSVLKEALATVQRHLVIVSPFLAEAAIAADGIDAGISAAVKRGVQVRIVSDPQLSRDPVAFERCVRRLENAGAQVRSAATQGVHSKMLLVDRSWLVLGSFNWLSAVRAPESRWARYESSLRYDGNEAFEMIARSLRDLAEVVGAAARGERAMLSARIVEGDVDVSAEERKGR